MSRTVVRTSGCWWLLVLPLLGSAVAWAQESNSTPQEQEEIEKALAADAAAAAKTRPEAPPAAEASAAPSGGFSLQSFIPDLSFIADFGIGAFSSDEPLQAGGHDPKQTGFALQQLELAVGSSVDPYFRFDANLVFGQEGVELEEAYATTTSLPASLQLRVGQFLTRFGRFNATHLHAWDFVDQPFVLSRVFGGEGNRGLGFELSYLTPLPWFVELVGSVTDASGEETARSFYGAEPLRIRSPLDFQLTGAIKQFFALSDDWSVLWGLSIAAGPNPTGPHHRSYVVGTDLYVKFRPLSNGDHTVVALQGEWIYRRREDATELLYDSGGYVGLFWKFLPRWGVAGRYEYGTATLGWEGLPREDPLDPEWLAERHRVSANLTLWPTEFSRLRLQGAMDLPRWQTEPGWSVFLAFEVAIGAHGAHRF
jgi:hypothetical protein